MRTLNSPDYPPDVYQRAQAIRLLILDVDGVLTDGRLYFDAQGRDPQGLSRAGRPRPQAGAAGRDRGGLGVGAALRRGLSPGQGVGDQPLSRGRAGQGGGAGGDHGRHADSRPRRWRRWATTWWTCPIMGRVGLAVAVADAVPEVLAAAHWVTSLPGGRGAVREVCDLLLKAQGKWPGVVSL